MDLDTECIPLGHIQTYFNIQQSLRPDPHWIGEKTRIDVSRIDESVIQTVFGLSQKDMMEAAGIPYRDGETAGRFVSARQVLDMVRQLIDVLDMPYVGMAMGNLMTVSHHGMAGLAAVTQPTLWDTLTVLERFTDALFPAMEIRPFRGEQEIWMGISENVSLQPFFHFFVELNLVSFYNIYADLVGARKDLMPSRIELSYPRPEWGHIYDRYFDCPVIFDAPACRVCGPLSAADYEMPLANRLLAMTAEKTLFENVPTKAMKLLPLRLRKLLLRYYGAYPSLEKAASELGMSGRSLRRKLAETGTSYQHELDWVREKFAREYFYRGGESVSELAELLGFADSSALAKAFRRWTGMSPTEFAGRHQRTR